MEIVTKSGFKCEVDDDVIDSWDMMEAIAQCEIEETAISGIVNMVTTTLGKRGVKALQKHLKKIHGKCDAKVLYNEFEEILEQLKAGNSFSSQEQ